MKRLNISLLTSLQCRKYGADDKSLLCEVRFFAFISQRLMYHMAHPEDNPRDIYITAHLSAPLMPDALELIEDKKQFAASSRCNLQR